MDAAVSNIMENAVLQAAHQMEDQLDNQMHAMDNLREEDIEQLRKHRIAQLKKQQDKKQQWLQRGHGECQNLQDEKEFFASMKGEDKMVCHFYRDNWPCKVIDKHIGILCKQHLECKFTRIDAEKSPYLVEKLKIWMLPTLALVRSEKVVDYVVGLDDMGGRDDFPTEVLAGRLAAAGVLTLKSGDAGKGPGAQRNVRKGGAGALPNRGSDDEDSDFD